MIKFPLKLIMSIILMLAAMAGVSTLFSTVRLNEIKANYMTVFFTQLKSINTEVTGKIKGKEHSLENYQEAFSSIDLFDFSDVVLLTPGGAVQYSTSDAYSDAFISELGNKYTLFFEQSGSSLAYDAEEKVLLVFAPFNDFSPHRIMGVMSYAEYDALIFNAKLYGIFEVSTIFLVAIVGCMFIVYIFKHRYDLLYYVKPVNNYILKINNKGKILHADTEFNKRFEKFNLAEKVFEKKSNFAQEIISGRNIILDVKDKQDNNVKLMCAFTATISGYKVVCSDMSTFVNEFSKLKNDDLTVPCGLWNQKKLHMDWKTFLRSKSYGNAVMVIFHMLSKDYFYILFGEASMRSNLIVYSKNLHEKMSIYGELYSLDSSDVALFINNAENKENFVKKLNEISEVLNQPLRVENQVIKLDTRIGVVLLDSVQEGTDLEAVLFAGKKSIKNASQSDRMRYYVLRAASFDNAKRDLATKEGVMELMRNGGIDVWFQPQYNINTNKIIGMEALCRIVGDRAKEITVADFVEAAEETGQIVEMGKFIYEKAMDFAKIIRNENVKVSINVSPIQLMQMGFVDAFLNAFNERGLEKGSIDIEIVENTFIYSIGEVIRKLKILKTNGINSQIDDFGIAYSSIFYLKKMPVTTLKIDKAFIDGLGFSEMDNLIVKNIINMAKDLGLNCIAEGVESNEQMEILRGLGCEIIQGFLIGRAMPKEKAYALIKEKNSL